MGPSKFFEFHTISLSDSSQHKCSIPIEHRPPLEACLIRGAIYPPTQAPSLALHGPATTTATPQAVVMITPPNIDLANGVYNPSFDVTPAELISAIVTEKGAAVKGETGVFDLSGVI